MQVTVNNSIAKKAVAVTPSDTTVLSATIGVYVGGAGNLVVTMADGNDITLTGVLAGTIYPLSVTKVKATNTTATNIVAVY